MQPTAKIKLNGNAVTYAFMSSPVILWQPDLKQAHKRASDHKIPPSFHVINSYRLSKYLPSSVVQVDTNVNTTLSLLNDTVSMSDYVAPDSPRLTNYELQRIRKEAVGA
jgi:hypothetical protein